MRFGRQAQGRHAAQQVSADLGLARRAHRVRGRRDGAHVCQGALSRELVGRRVRRFGRGRAQGDGGDPERQDGDEAQPEPALAPHHRLTPPAGAAALAGTTAATWRRRRAPFANAQARSGRVGVARVRIA